MIYGNGVLDLLMMLSQQQVGDDSGVQMMLGLGL